jgi:hypothetical protein
MPLISITPPTAEPIDLVEVKLHLRVDIPDDDTLIVPLMGAARDYAENLTKKQFVAARWKQVMDGFPSNATESSGGLYGKAYARPGNAIYLERSPVAQIVSVQYLDLQGVIQTMPAANYVADLSSDPVRITPVFGQIWPIPMPQIGSVWVIYDAGYATPITASGNNITVKNWQTMAVGDVVRFSNSGGALPAPLAQLTDYYVQSVVSAGVYTFSATSGGAVIPLTTTGTGTSYLGVIPQGIKAWMKIRLGALYENREEVAILSRGKIEALPYVDRLLDGYKTYEF